MEPKVAEEMFEFNLRGQVKPLVQRWFPLLGRMNKIPALKIQHPGDADYAEGPAHLNAQTGTIYIDERVAEFQEKTTKILILHELTHWSLFVENGDPDEHEGIRFQTEIERLVQAGAYKGLL